jgi:hypothetical protein
MAACRRAIRSVPVQHGLGAHQQPQSVQHLAGQAVEDSGEQHPVSGGEPDLLAVQLPFEDGDLVPEYEDLCILVTVTHREQSQQGERVGHAEVGQSKQHGRSSSRSDRRRSEAGWRR